MTKKSYIGSVFGRLTVIGDVDTTGPRYVRVKCECGSEKESRLDSLTRGVTVSCGCKKKEHNFRHGHRRSGVQDPTYTSWDSMWQRCTNPNSPTYAYYGGRGISVDQAWSDFKVFLGDMGVRPSLDHDLDRKDNDKDYCRSNCRWATRGEQMMNTRRVVVVVWNGHKRKLRELALELGLDPVKVTRRFRSGWTVEESLSLTRTHGNSK